MAKRTTSPTQKLRDQFLNELQSEAQKILKELSQQFTSDLQSQGAEIVQGLTGSLSDGVGAALNDASGLTKLFGSALSFAINRPHTTVSTRESARSQQADQFFRVSHRQALAEAGLELNKVFSGAFGLRGRSAPATAPPLKARRWPRLRNVSIQR